MKHGDKVLENAENTVSACIIEILDTEGSSTGSKTTFEKIRLENFSKTYKIYEIGNLSVSMNP